MLDVLLPSADAGREGNWQDDAVFSAVVATDPDADGRVFVTIPEYHPELRHGPCPVMPRGTALPRRGAPCLVAFADDRTPWVVGWEGGIGGGDVVTPDQLAAEVAAREAADAAHAAQTVAAHGGIVAATDPRLTNPRTPTAHAGSHASGGSDQLLGGGYAVFTGPWQNGPPPTTESGAPFSVPIAGQYLITVAHSGYTDTVGLFGSYMYIDGIHRMSASHYFNQTFVHTQLAQAVGIVPLAAGTHYLAIWFDKQSDGGDRGSLSAVRVG